MTRAARAILDQSDGITLRAGQIEAQDRVAGRMLAGLIRAAATGMAELGGVVAVPRPSGRTAYVLSVARCFADLSTLLDLRGAVVVTIADPAREVATSPAASWPSPRTPRARSMR